MQEDRLAGIDAFAASNGPVGVLVLHGFTGSPRSMRPLAEAFADSGFSVELPLLPGHGTSVEDLATTSFSDWAAFAESALLSLRVRTDHTVVIGHSMGGALALWLAQRGADISGLVLINPLIAPPAESFFTLLDGALASGASSIPSIGGDIKREGMQPGGYNATPIAPLRSLMGALAEISAHLGDVVCPTLLFSSRVDHVVPVESGDLVEARIGGPVERVFLENSFHIATLDNDAGEIEERSIAFATKLVAA